MLRNFMKRLNFKGDTIIEVMLAMSLLTSFLFISWGITNRSTQIGINARKRIVMVNAMKEQAEALKSLHAQSQGEIERVIGSGRLAILPADYNKSSCDSTPDGQYSFHYELTGDDLAITSGIKAMPDADNAVWVQYLPRDNESNPTYYDFYIRACWQTIGGNQTEDNSQFIVRLNKNQDFSASVSPTTTVSTGITTLAYEDIYPGPGDYDFNDFLVNMRVTETYSNADNGLESIVIEYYPEKHMTAFTNSFHLVFDGRVRSDHTDAAAQAVTSFVSEPMFAGSANITYELFDRGVSNPVAKQENVPSNQNLTVFANTSQVFEDTSSYNQQYKQWAKITITGFDKSQNIKKPFSIKRYRSFLRVRQPDPGISSYYYDVDLSDINCNMYDGTPQRMPLAVYVPSDWAAPQSTERIYDKYPNFPLHANYLRNTCGVADPEPEKSPPEGGLNWFTD
jgi:LruC domain-containing protein